MHDRPHPQPASGWTVPRTVQSSPGDWTTPSPPKGKGASSVSLFALQIGSGRSENVRRREPARSDHQGREHRKRRRLPFAARHQPIWKRKGKPSVRGHWTEGSLVRSSRYDGEAYRRLGQQGGNPSQTAPSRTVLGRFGLLAHEQSSGKCRHLSQPPHGPRRTVDSHRRTGARGSL